MDNTLSFLQSQNPDLTFYRVQGPNFMKYGQIYNDIQVTSLIKIALFNFPFVKGTIYLASSIDLEKCKCIEEIKRSCFGQTEIQVGLCWEFALPELGVKNLLGFLYFIAVIEV